MRKDIDIALIRTFIAATELGGFNKAATAVHRSQSAISMQLKRLEDIVGVALFARDGRKRRLTREGEEFVLYAQRLLSLHDQTLDAMDAGKKAGYVRVGVMDDYAIEVLPELSAGFMNENPNVDLEITVGFSDRLMTRLGEDFDLVLSTHPVGEGIGTVLRHERTRWAYAKTLDLPDKTVLPLALLPPGNLFRRWGLQALEAMAQPWRVAFTGSSIATVEAAAAAGIGVTIVKEGTALKGLRFLAEEDGFPDLPDTEIVLNRASSANSRAVDAMAQYILAFFNAEA